MYTIAITIQSNIRKSEIKYAINNVCILLIKPTLNLPAVVAYLIKEYRLLEGIMKHKHRTTHYRQNYSIVYNCDLTNTLVGIVRPPKGHK